MTIPVTIDPQLLARAQAVLDQHGHHAEAYAHAMLIAALHRQDAQAAALWLQLGHAIDLLTARAAAPLH